MTTTASRSCRPFWSRFACSLAALTLAGSLAACSNLQSDPTADPASSSTTTSSTATASSSASTGSSETTTAGTIKDTSAAAEAFLATLTDEQREQLLYAYDDATKTTSWSNFPVTFVQRAGLNLADLSTEQQDAAMLVLEALLSTEGYETVTGIMAGDEFLLANSSSSEASLGQYYIAFFGEPSDATAWEVQFGGHHLGINATLIGAEESVTFAPTHLGVQPASFTDAAGTEVQPMASMYSTAFAFYDSLSAEQQVQLYQGSSVANLSCAPGDTCDYPTGTGIAGADLTGEQRQLLLEVITNWVGLADEETTAEALAAIEASLDETFVSWSGATVYDTSQGDGIYFQISGPDVFIEFSSQQGSAGADVAGYVTEGWGHVHSIYRDPAQDYAGSVTQQSAAGMMGGGSGAAAPGGIPPAG